MSGFIINIVGCVVLEVLAGILLPEGKMKKFALSIISLFLFYSLVYPLCDYILEGRLTFDVSGLFENRKI